MIAPLVAHFLISLMFVVSAVSSTAQWKTLRPADIVLSISNGIGVGVGNARLNGRLGEAPLTAQSYSE